MARRRLLLTAFTSVSSLALAGAGLAGPAWAAAGHGAAPQVPAGQGKACSAGAHTLSPPRAAAAPNRPSITGPGLAGPGFYDGSCPA